MKQKEDFFLEKEREIDIEMKRKNLSITFSVGPQKKERNYQLSAIQKNFLERVKDQKLKLAVFEPLNNGEKTSYRLLTNTNNFLTKNSRKTNRHVLASLIRKGLFVLEKKEERYQSYIFYRYRLNEKKYLELIMKDD